MPRTTSRNRPPRDNINRQNPVDWTTLTDPADITNTPTEAPASPGTPEAAVSDAENTVTEIDNMPDKDIRYTDAEILGSSYRVKRLIHSSTGHSMRAAEFATAKFKNMLETPGKLRQRFVTFIAEKRYNRHQTRFDKVSHLPEGNRLRVRREAKLNRATIRLENARNTLEERIARMKDRTSDIGERHETREANYTAELIGRKEEALARRELRRELRRQGAGPVENVKMAGYGPVKGEIFKETPPEELRRFGRLARNLELSETQLRSAEYSGKRIDSKKEELETKLKSNVSLTESQQASIAIAKGELANIKDMGNDEGITAKNILLMELYGERDALPDDDPDRVAAQTRIDTLEEEIENLEATIRSLEFTIENASKLVSSLAAERPQIEKQIRQTEARKAKHVVDTDEIRALHHQDIEARNEAAQEVLTN